MPFNAKLVVLLVLIAFTIGHFIDGSDRSQLLALMSLVMAYYVFRKQPPPRAGH